MMKEERPVFQPHHLLRQRAPQISSAVAAEPESEKKGPISKKEKTIGKEGAGGGQVRQCKQGLYWNELA